ncbi:MAG: helix-turn-helix domain-containing protein [Chloroflexi bacterium]|nr:helix-turn-helix domain-containing protein [Chloroflexota bacterium]
MHIIHKAFKDRICPNQNQQAAPPIQCRHARFVYNWGRSRRLTR